MFVKTGQYSTKYSVKKLKLKLVLLNPNGNFFFLFLHQVEQSSGRPGVRICATLVVVSLELVDQYLTLMIPHEALVVLAQAVLQR